MMIIGQVVTRFSLCLLAWCTLVVAPAFAQTIVHEPLITFDGESSLDFFGGAVSGAGDVNGDGFADVIVGAQGDDGNGNNSGSAQVFSGSDGSVLYEFEGDSDKKRCQVRMAFINISLSHCAASSFLSWLLGFVIKV